MDYITLVAYLAPSHKNMPVRPPAEIPSSLLSSYDNINVILLSLTVQNDIFRDSRGRCIIFNLLSIVPCCDFMYTGLLAEKGFRLSEYIISVVLNKPKLQALVQKITFVQKDHI